MSERPKPRGLGHLVLNVRDLDASVRFYTDMVGLEISDYIGNQMAFLRCTEEHHNLALAQIPADVPHRESLYVPGRPGLEHFSFRLESLEEIEAAATRLQGAGIEIV